MGQSRPKEIVVPPPNRTAGHPDEVVTVLRIPMNVPTSSHRFVIGSWIRTIDQAVAVQEIWHGRRAVLWRRENCWWLDGHSSRPWLTTAAGRPWRGKDHRNEEGGRRALELENDQCVSRYSVAQGILCRTPHRRTQRDYLTG